MHLSKHNIKISKYFTALPGEYDESDFPFSFPLFLKSTDAANGNGVDDLSFVTSFADFGSKVLSLYHLYNQPILIEEYLNCGEFTVAIIEGANNHLIISTIEIAPPKSVNGLPILGAKTKKDNSELLMKIVDLSLIKKVKEQRLKRLRD